MKRQKKTLLEIVGSIIFTLSSIYALNHIIFFLATKREQLITKNGDFYKHHHGKMYYEKRGHGSPVLLLHDLNCCSSSYEWQEVVNSFAKNHTVYTVDLLGCGRSDKPRITYTSYLYVQILSDFIHEVICDTPDVIVTGNTVPIAIMLEKLHHNSFSHMIFVNPLDFDKASKFPNTIDSYKKDLWNAPILGTLAYCIYTSKSAILKRFRSEYFFLRPSKELRYLRRYHEAAHLKGSSSKFLHSSIRCHYLGCNVTEVFTELDVSACVILGDAMEYTTDISDWAVFLNPRTEVAILPDSKYLPQIEAAEQFVEICETFFTNNTIE